MYMHMKTTLIGTVLIVLACSIFFIIFYNNSETLVEITLEDTAPVSRFDMTDFTLGTYGYRCGEGTEFTMSPSSDMSRLLIMPVTSVERIPEMIMQKAVSQTGARYEKDGFSFHAQGETVVLEGSSFSTACLPIHLPDEAPFNFGD